MRIQVSQILSVADTQENVNTIQQEVEVAAKNRADLVVFPECSMFLARPLDHRAVEAAEEVNTGNFVGKLREFAATSGVAIVAGMFEKDPESDSRCFNTAVVINSVGTLIAKYRKIQLADNFGGRESDVIRPSDSGELISFALDDIRFGVLICHDLRYPELARVLTLRDKIDCLLLPTAWVAGPMKEMHLHTLLRARAIENAIYSIGVDQAAPVRAGASIAFDPNGVVLAASDGSPTRFTVEISRARLDEVRRANPVLTLARVQGSVSF